MDNGERLEAEVESIKEQLHEIKEEQVRLREGLDKLRDHMDQGFAEMRAEQARTTRWLIGIGISYGTAIIGLIAKMAGMFRRGSCPRLSDMATIGEFSLASK